MGFQTLKSELKINQDACKACDKAVIAVKLLKGCLKIGWLDLETFLQMPDTHAIRCFYRLQVPSQNEMIKWKRKA